MIMPGTPESETKAAEKERLALVEEERARLRRLSAAGRASTIATSSSGITGSTPTLAKTSLLGGGR